MTSVLQADLLRAAVHTAKMGLWAWCIATDHVMVSTGWKRQLGEDDADLVFDLNEWESRIHPDDLAEVRRGLEEYLAHPERDYRAELRLRHADGSWRWMLAMASLVRDEAARPQYLVGSHVDISEQKRITAELAFSNQALRESNRQLEAAQRMGRIGHWERDLQSGVLLWSDQTYRLFGRIPRQQPVDGQLAADFAGLVHPADRGRLAQATRDAIEHGTAIDLEYRVVRPDGQVLTVHSQATLERDADGRPRRLFGVIQDVTEWRKAEESLHAAERQLRTLIDSVPDFISRFDLQGRFVYVSGAVGRITGATPDVVVGKTPLELGICADPAGDRALQDSLARVAAGGEPEQLEVCFRTPSGPRHFEVRHLPERDERGTLLSVLGLARDVTDRKTAERQLYLLNYALDNIGEGIYLMEGDTPNFVYVNQGAADQLGYSRAELTGGMSVLDIDPDFSPERWEQLLPIIRERRRLTIETVHRTRGGVLVPVEVAGNYFEFEGQKFNMAIVRNIAERKAAEAALRESEVLYRSLVTTMAEGVVVRRADGAITAVNPAAERIVGRSAAEMLGPDPATRAPITLREDGSPFPAEAHPSTVTLRSGEPQSNVIMGVRRHDGSLVWISINSQPMRREAATLPFAVVTTFHDITALKHSELQLRTLAENSPDVILRFDSAGRCLFTNRAFARLFGAGDPLVASGGSGHSLHQALASRVAEVCSSRSPVESETVLALPDGEHTFNVRLIPETDDVGRLGSVLAVVRDVTEQKRYSVELAAREAQLRAVIETAVDAIVTIDERGTIEHANTATERIFGYPVSELLGHNVKILMNGHDAVRHDGYLARARSGARSPIIGQQREVVGRRRDGSLFPADLSVSEFFVGTTRRFTGMIRDISERKRFERMISDSELRLRTAVAYELHDTVGQLLAGGHFLAQNLIPDLPDELRPRATRVAEILSDTLAKIRAFSKNLEVLDTARFSFTQALHSLAEKISAVYELGSRVQLDTQDEPPLTQRRQAYLVVEEAVANAIRHSYCSEIVLRFSSCGGRYRLAVEDDGRGVSDEQSGDGMGLTTMRYRAQLLGGFLEVVRRQPRGTSVILDWPGEGTAP